MKIEEKIKFEANNKISRLICEKYARPNSNTKNASNRKLLLAVLLCSLIVLSLTPFSIIGIKSLISASMNDHSSQISSENTYFVMPWSERTVFQKYPVLVYEGNYYGISSEYDSKFSNENVEAKISDSTTIYSVDIIAHETHTETVSLFSIKKIDTRAAVLVKFDDYEDFYPYCSVDTYFSSLGEFLNSYDLYNQISFENNSFVYRNKGDIYCHNFSSLNKNIVWQTLFSNPSSVNIAKIVNEMGIKEDEEMYLGFSVPLLGLKTTVNTGTFIKLFRENKYVIISIQEASFLFKVEGSGIDDLFSYLLSIKNNL